MAIRANGDAAKMGWEDSEFPILCETCLGDNPYVRMSRSPYASCCRVCARVCTRFVWKAGSAGRFKTVVLCQLCARVKNVCQCCVLDLKYGLPVEVRDGVVAAAGGASLLAPVHTAVSDTNRQHAMSVWAASHGEGEGAHTHTHTHALAHAPAAGGAPPGAEAVHAELLRLGRERTAALGFTRNAAKVCTFFARGECTRGDACPYRHTQVHPRSHPGALGPQNIKDRYLGQNDAVAGKIMARMKEHPAPGGGGDTSALTKLWLGGIPDACTQAEVTAVMAPHGDIRDVHISSKGDCAFVEFGSHVEAEKALLALAGNLSLRGKRVVVDWARPKAEAAGARLHGAAADADAAATGVRAVDTATPAGAAFPFPLPYMMPGMPVPSSGDAAAASHAGGATGVAASGGMPFAAGMPGMMMPYPFAMMPYSMPPIVGVASGAMAVGGQGARSTGPARSSYHDAHGGRGTALSRQVYASMDPARMGATVQE